MRLRLGVIEVAAAICLLVAGFGFVAGWLPGFLGWGLGILGWLIGTALLRASPLCPSRLWSWTDWLGATLISSAGAVGIAAAVLLPDVFQTPTCAQSPIGSVRESQRP